MNVISGDINILFDLLFVCSVIVNKFLDMVCYGGNVIGGSVEIDLGLILCSMEDKDQLMELVLCKGFNVVDVQGFCMNFNNQCNFLINLQVLCQCILYYDIFGNSKVVVCNICLFLLSGGVNLVLVDSCQKEVCVQQIYNKVLQLYIDQFMIENLDWVDGDFLFYINYLILVWQCCIYINLVNLVYVFGILLYVQKQINNDVMFDYYYWLGNSYVCNLQVVFGLMLFFDRGYVGVSIDVKDSEYGVLGFLMQNLLFGFNYVDGLLVGVVIKQECYVLEVLLCDLLLWFQCVELCVLKLDNILGECLGSIWVNDYDFESSQVEFLFSYLQFGLFSGLFGFSYQLWEVIGSGLLCYLFDVDICSNVVFLKEILDVGWVIFDVGVCYECVDYELQFSCFRIVCNVVNMKLDDCDYWFNSYSFGLYVEFGLLFVVKVCYLFLQCVLEINELYVSNVYYLVMIQEEGNQNFKFEYVKNLELIGLFYIGGFELLVIVYWMKYENYLYLGYFGVQMVNCLLLKYWKQIDIMVKGFEIDVLQVLDLGCYGMLNVFVFVDLVKNKVDSFDLLCVYNDGEYLLNMLINCYGVSLQWQC